MARDVALDARARSGKVTPDRASPDGFGAARQPIHMTKAQALRRWIIGSLVAVAAALPVAPASASASASIGFGPAVENPQAFDLEYGWRAELRAGLAPGWRLDGHWQRMLVQEGGVEDWSDEWRLGARWSPPRDGGWSPYARVEALHYRLDLGALSLRDTWARPELGMVRRADGARFEFGLGIRWRGVGQDDSRALDDAPVAVVARIDCALVDRWSLGAEVDASRDAHRAWLGMVFAF